MRVATLLAAAGLLAVLATGCGGDPEPPGREPHVRLELQAPADTRVVDADAVDVRGVVAPGNATVMVLGREADVSGGRFSARVPLEEGVNLIDVSASATGARTEFAVVRVEREIRITIPRLVGQEAVQAEAELSGLGLEVAEQRGGGFFDSLIPGDREVCDLQPEPGSRVAPGTKVTVLVAKRC